MKLPDTAVVLRQTANPTQDHAAFDHHSREPLADDRSGLFAGEFEGGPSVRLVELFDEQRGSLFKNAVGLIGKIKNLHWQHSYVAGDKTFCIYLAESQEHIRQHAELSGIPLTRIIEISRIIDPLTANN